MDKTLRSQTKKKIQKDNALAQAVCEGDKASICNSASAGRLTVEWSSRVFIIPISFYCCIKSQCSWDLEISFWLDSTILYSFVLISRFYNWIYMYCNPTRWTELLLFEVHRKPVAGRWYFNQFDQHISVFGIKILSGSHPVISDLFLISIAFTVWAFTWCYYTFFKTKCDNY